MATPDPMGARAAAWPAWLWPAALDGLLLGLFMVAAACFGTWLELPTSPLRAAFDEPWLRRFLMGVAMGATAVALIHSPMGQRSGAHFNPATTLTFLRLGRVAPGVAIGYIAAQCVGGALGLAIAAWGLWPAIAAPEVRYVLPQPGPAGLAAAFATEVAMTFVLMTVVLHVGQSRRLHRWTSACVGTLLCAFITFAAPLSGTSLNPARSFASALVAGDFTALWLYATAPVLGMLLAAEWFVRGRRARTARCAKLHHDNAAPCPFRCGWDTA